MTGDISILIPVCDEGENLSSLVGELEELTADFDLVREVIFIDDGSGDDTYRQLVGLASQHQWLSALQLRRNYGKGAALLAGLEVAKGEYIFTMDGDGQDDPRELPHFWQAHLDGSDVVLGWRKVRRDPWGKVVPSKIYNLLISKLTGLAVHDINCGMRFFPRPAVKEVDFYGDQYRLLPALLHHQGYRVTEREVTHRPRTKGRSKYGKSRFLTGLLDIATVVFLARFRLRPAHFFGPLGLVFILAGLAINIYITYLRLTYGTIQFRYPLLILGVMLLVVGIQFISTGFLAEMMAFFLHREKRPYSIRRTTEEESVSSDEGEKEDGVG